ncbi:MAG: hypothetical protein WCQ32_01515 [bacterium]
MSINSWILLIVGVILLFCFLYFNRDLFKSKRLEEEKKLREIMHPWGILSFAGRNICKLFVVEEILNDRVGIRYVGEFPQYITCPYADKEVETISFTGSLLERKELSFLSRKDLPIEIQEIGCIIQFLSVKDNVFEVKKYHPDNRFLSALICIDTYIGTISKKN